MTLRFPKPARFNFSESARPLSWPSSGASCRKSKLPWREAPASPCRRSPARNLGRSDRNPPIFFSTAETCTPDLVPALAVLFFAGLRPNEMLRLTWESIDLEARVIRLTGEQTKTRTMRNVDVSDNLLAWSVAHRGTGPLVASLGRYRGQRETLMKRLGIADWPTDVARHTFATMHYNAHQNAAATMAQLGHFGNPQTFVTHYKGVPVSAADVKAFWAIVPTAGVSSTSTRLAGGCA